MSLAAIEIAILNIQKTGMERIE